MGRLFGFGLALSFVLIFNGIVFSQDRPVRAARVNSDATTTQNFYDIRIDSIDAQYAYVEARLNVQNGRLITGTGGSYDWQNGWFDYLDNFSASTIVGTSLNIEMHGESFASYLQLSDDGEAFNGIADVSYRVDIGYAKVEWDFGNEQMGRIYNGGLYTVTKAFFLSSEIVNSSQIHFTIPEEWMVASPWEPVEGIAKTYEAPDWDSLHNNSITLGEFESIQTTSNGFELEIVLLGDFPEASKLVSNTINEIIPIYLDIFPNTPVTRYSMTYLRGQSEDAEAFKNGAAFTTNLDISTDTQIFWADFLAHELFHYWNGARIRTDERWESNWFKEGFTDYYANITLRNRDMLSEAWLIRRMENIFGNYLYFQFSSAFNTLTVLEAGKDKGRNRFGVYDAGWVLAFALDNEIYNRTDGEKSLDVVMSALYERYIETEEKLDLETLLEVASTSTGLDLNPFFDKYLKTRTPLPLVDIMRSFGWTSYSNKYANEYYLTVDKDADEAAMARWNYLTRQRFNTEK